jgi:hypothetical protein
METETEIVENGNKINPLTETETEMNEKNLNETGTEMKL